MLSHLKRNHTDPPIQRHHTHSNWLFSPYINDILHAYVRAGNSARKTVDLLKREAPDQRYARLSHSTILSWYDSNHKLHPHIQQQIDLGQQTSKGKRGRVRLFNNHPDTEEEITQLIQRLRDQGAIVNIRIVRWIMKGVIETRCPQLLEQHKLSNAFISRWAHQQLDLSWRRKTTTASKLPNDWEEQGTTMAIRLAAMMKMHEVHHSLVINMDQTGINLVPSSDWTYAQKASKSVGIIGGEDKRQITCCVASSMDGELLPLQLIFEGKTNKCHPPHTLLTQSTNCHVTHSENHWSNQQTMQDYLKYIILPFSQRMINKYQLASDSKIILLLDYWSVHKSEAFRMHLRMHYPHIHLLFIPPNCTSKLQVADVALQRPFKQRIKTLFNQWAAEQVREFLNNSTAVETNQLGKCLQMSIIKPKIFEWIVESWKHLSEQREMILNGWNECCKSRYNMMDPEKRSAACEILLQKQLQLFDVPDDEEENAIDEDEAGLDSEEEDEILLNELTSDEEHDPIPFDQTKQHREGERRSKRQKIQTNQSTVSYMINSSQLQMSTDDSDLN